MKAALIAVALSCLLVYLWRSTTAELRASVWRAGRYYLLAAVLALIFAWLGMNLSANTTAIKFL